MERLQQEYEERQRLRERQEEEKRQRAGREVEERQRRLQATSGGTGAERPQDMGDQERVLREAEERRQKRARLEEEKRWKGQQEVEERRQRLQKLSQPSTTAANSRKWPCFLFLKATISKAESCSAIFPDTRKFLLSSRNSLLLTTFCAF